MGLPAEGTIKPLFYCFVFYPFYHYFTEYNCMVLQHLCTYIFFHGVFLDDAHGDFLDFRLTGPAAQSTTAEIWWIRMKLQLLLQDTEFPYHRYSLNDSANHSSDMSGLFASLDIEEPYRLRKEPSMRLGRRSAAVKGSGGRRCR